MATEVASSSRPRAPRSEEAAFTPGSVLAGRYRIVSLLGRGGMGEVYRADDLKLGLSVALKFLPREVEDDAALKERFLAEVRIARQVTHPNVCRVFDLVELDGRPAMSMELVDGEDLAALLRRIGRLPHDKAVDVARQLCAGLAAAHERGVLHRDLKPANVMLDGRGKVRITDFGLAVAAAEGGRPGDIAGTPAYMAPEQLAGQEASVRSDLFALGLVLHEVFTGKRVFQAATLAELRRQQDEPLSTPSTHAADLDPATERVILRCLERDPAQRPASALAVAAALPGGDPLAAALAAGETPSPEMVAAAGASGTQPFPHAARLVGVVLAALVATFLLTPHATVLGLVPFRKSPAYLAQKAEDLARRLGYPRPADSVYWLENEIELQERSRDALATTWPGPTTFRYLETAEAVAVPHLYTFERWAKPFRDRPGSLLIALDAEGRLIELRHVSEGPEELRPSGQPDWRPILTEAGVDLETVRQAQPRWRSPVAHDSRIAWEARLTGGAGDVRFEAAASGGRVSWFRAFPDAWPPPARPAGTTRVVTRVLAIGSTVIIVGILGVAAFVALRNLRLGRGDRRGARLTFVAGAASVAVGWLLQVPHSGALENGLAVLSQLLGLPLVSGGFCWLLYLALEPEVRARLPRVLISWTRLAAADWRDPLVGRDVLVGVAAGAANSALNLLAFALPAIAHLPGFAPDSVSSRVLVHTSDAVGALATTLIFGLQNGLFALGVLYVALLLSRRMVFVAGFVCLLMMMATGNPGGGFSLSTLVYPLVGGPLLTFVLLRYGLLPFALTSIANVATNAFPMTLDLSLWYARSTALALAFVFALVAYGSLAATGRLRRGR